MLRENDPRLWARRAMSGAVSAGNPATQEALETFRALDRQVRERKISGRPVKGRRGFQSPIAIRDEAAMEIGRQLAGGSN